MPSIQVNSLCFSYEQPKEILTHIGFAAKAHESIGLIGANGTGKSTLLKLLVL